MLIPGDFRECWNEDTRAEILSVVREEEQGRRRHLYLGTARWLPAPQLSLRPA